MAWETRARGGQYYTRSVRRDGRICREYIGTGPVAETIAAVDLMERSRRQAEHRALAVDRQASLTVEEAVMELDRAVETLARLELVCAGFHQHHRGQWRKRREQETQVGSKSRYPH